MINQTLRKESGCARHKTLTPDLDCEPFICHVGWLLIRYGG